MKSQPRETGLVFLMLYMSSLEIKKLDKIFYPKFVILII
jgi:hypothetical protein